jgi:sigma-54 dependent transcriptional regulator, acetoin dehydrogenase operon transcriptional activator AcoR
MSTHALASHPAALRLARIAQARTAVLQQGMDAGGMLEPWIERSWQRCLQSGMQTRQRVLFQAVSASQLRLQTDSHRQLLAAASQVMPHVARSLSATRYFAILTNAQGTVIQVDGPVDHSDPRAHAIARRGIDLSEHSVGTTAIGTCLAEQQSVWLHRGEHFFDDTAVYSCAGSPIFNPLGQCVGMLDFTGINAPERRELLSLAQHATQQMEDAMVQALPHALMLQLNWPGDAAQTSACATIAVDADGRILGGNRAAINMTGLNARLAKPHLDELFALPSARLWDAAQSDEALLVPLWNGLRLSVRARRSNAVLSQMGGAVLQKPSVSAPSAAAHNLKAVEMQLIAQAVQNAQGNVAVAAKKLGISRATIYRKLSKPSKPNTAP